MIKAGGVGKNKESSRKGRPLNNPVFTLWSENEWMKRFVQMRSCILNYNVGWEEKPEALHYLTENSSAEVTALEFSDSRCLTSVWEKLKCMSVCVSVG